jgi:hypothetical protein
MIFSLPTDRSGGGSVLSFTRLGFTRTGCLDDLMEKTDPAANGATNEVAACNVELVPVLMGKVDDTSGGVDLR